MPPETASARTSFREPRVVCYLNMKLTIDIPDSGLEDVIRFSGAKTKREAVVTAVADFNRRKRMAELIRHAGTCSGLITAEELESERRKN